MTVATRHPCALSYWRSHSAAADCTAIMMQRAVADTEALDYLDVKVVARGVRKYARIFVDVERYRAYSAPACCYSCT